MAAVFIRVGFSVSDVAQIATEGWLFVRRARSVLASRRGGGGWQRRHFDCAWATARTPNGNGRSSAFGEEADGGGGFMSNTLRRIDADDGRIGGARGAFEGETVGLLGEFAANDSAAAAFGAAGPQVCKTMRMHEDADLSAEPLGGWRRRRAAWPTPLGTGRCTGASGWPAPTPRLPPAA
jgi:hypothetical protein